MSAPITSPGVVGTRYGDASVTPIWHPGTITDPEWRFPASERDVQEGVANPGSTMPEDPERFPGQGVQPFVQGD